MSEMNKPYKAEAEIGIVPKEVSDPRMTELLDRHAKNLAEFTGLTLNVISHMIKSHRQLANLIELTLAAPEDFKEKFVNLPKLLRYNADKIENAVNEAIKKTDADQKELMAHTAKLNALYEADKAVDKQIESGEAADILKDVLGKVAAK